MEIETTFQKVFTLFHHCHRTYDSNVVTDREIVELGKLTEYIQIQNYHTFRISETNIKEFMAFYRASFPTATVLPKMHMLEELHG